MGLIRAMRNHRGCTVLAVLALLLLGGGTAGWLWMSRYRADPEEAESGHADRRVGPCAVVVTAYPGMSASLMEETITNRLERWINRAPGVERTASRSTAGLSLVYVQFHKGADPQAALAMTGQLAQETLPALPPDTPPPMVHLIGPAGELPLGYLAVDNPKLDLGQRTDVARVQVQNMLPSVRGMVAPVVLGRIDRMILVYLDPKKMEARHISISAVMDAVKTNNLTVIPGIARLGDNRLLLNSNPTVGKIEELNELPLRSEPGNMVTLGVVGSAQDSYSFPTSIIRFNGRRTVCLPLFRSSSASAPPPSELRDSVSRRLPWMQERLPKGTRLQQHSLKSGSDGRSRLTIFLRAPSNLGLEATQKRVAEVEKFLEANIPEGERAFVFSEIGIAPDWSALYAAPNAGPCDATIRVQLADDAKTSAQKYTVKLRRLFRENPRFADLRVSFQPGKEKPIDIRIEGLYKLEELQALAKQVRIKAATVAGAADARAVQRIDAPSLVIDVDRRKAADVGLSPKEIILQATAALGSEVPIQRNFRVNGYPPCPVVCVYPERPGMKLEDMLNINATGHNRDYPVKLSSLATLRRNLMAVEIDHDNLVRVMDVHVNVEDRSRNAVVRDIEAALKGLEIPAGVTIDVLPEAPPWP